MLTYNQYVQPQTLEEAFALAQKKNNLVLGGTLWVRQQNRRYNVAVDLCALGLDKIEETETAYRIGAMTTLRTLEQHDGLNRLTGGAFAACVAPIVGVQFRNLATVGGSVFGRFGFSDVITLLLALDASVELYGAGKMSLEEFMGCPCRGDILTYVSVPKASLRVACQSMRNTKTDFSVLTCAAALCGENLRVAVGARPQPAALLHFALPITAEQAGEAAAKQLQFGSNLRGSAEYREKVCAVLVRRAVQQVLGEEQRWN